METNALLREYQKASPARRRDLESVILQQNSGLAVFIAQQYFYLFDPNGSDDAIQEGKIALLRAVRAFDPTRGANFATFATTVIHFHLGGFKKAASRPMRASETVSLDALSEAEVGTLKHSQYLKAIAREDVSLQGIEKKDFIRWLESELADREWRVLSGRYGLDGDEPKSLRRIADVLGISHESVRLTISDALRKLREALR